MTHAAQAAHDEGETASGLALVVPHLFAPLGVVLTSTTAEPDNAEYGGVLVTVHGLAGAESGAGAQVRVRAAKITPKKVGLFVTHWRRGSDGESGPYGIDDSADALLVTVAESGPRPARGVFVFGRESLAAHGIVAGGGQAGKRGFRVYPPWSQTAPGQASRTQRWQLEHFVPLPLGAAGADRARALTLSWGSGL